MQGPSGLDDFFSSPGPAMAIPAAAPMAARVDVAPVVPHEVPSVQEAEKPVPVAVPSQAAPPAAAAQEEQGGVRIGAEDTSADSSFLTDLLIAVLDRKCSDLHLTVGAAPTVRQNGHLVAVEDMAILTPQVLQKVIYAILSQKQRERFEEDLELDFAYSVPGRARFRVNIYQQRDSLGAAFRLIPYEIKPLEDLGVPPAVGNFAMLPRGFVLVTGPTGSGKSTTLAAVVDSPTGSARTTS